MHKPSQKLSIYYSFTSLISIIFSIVIKNVDNFRVKLKKNFFRHFQNVVIFRVKFKNVVIFRVNHNTSPQKIPFFKH